MYRAIHTLPKLQEYTSGAAFVGFGFKTAPNEKYRKEEKAALDAHKPHICRISFSVAEGDGMYLPLAYTSGQNAAGPEAIWTWLEGFFADPCVAKIIRFLCWE